MKCSEEYTARISIEIEKMPDWWLSIRADSKNTALKYIERSTQRDFIVKAVDDFYGNKLSELLNEIIDIPIGDLIKSGLADIKELYIDNYKGSHFENEKGVFAAGLRAFRRYNFRGENGDYFDGNLQD